MKIIDGDTYRCFIDLQVGGIWLDRSIRVADIDTPEIFKPKTANERERGLKAKQFVESQIPIGSTVYLRILGDDKYGGRLDALVFQTPSSRSFGEILKSKGHEK